MTSVLPKHYRISMILEDNKNVPVTKVFDSSNEQPRDIMQYESDIWGIADLLLSASIKQSDFPKFMMPFFALMMLEGRMLNAMKRVEEEESLTVKDDPEDFKEAFIDKGCGYNEYIVMQGKTLSSI